MIVTALLIVLSQMPSFHSLRYIKLASLSLCLGYTFLVVATSIRAGYLRNSPLKDYSLDPSKSARTFNAFTSISIMATDFGNGILLEIQATLAPAAAGKMVKGLMMSYVKYL